MATNVRHAIDITRTDRLTGNERASGLDRWIFVLTAAIFVAVTLISFVPDSIERVAAVSAGTRPPFPMLLHVHAVLMGSFLMLLLAQTWLAATGRIGQHMQLGIVTAAIAAALVVVGFMLAPAVYQLTVEAERTAAPALREGFQAMIARKENTLLHQLLMGVLFPLFFAIGILARQHDAGLHKRMMILATAVVLGGPVFARIDWLPPLSPLRPMSNDLYMLVLLAPMVVWDIIRNRYVHRAYVIWFAVSLPAMVVSYVLFDTLWWHATARAILTA